MATGFRDEQIAGGVVSQTHWRHERHFHGKRTIPGGPGGNAVPGDGRNDPRMLHSSNTVSTGIGENQALLRIEHHERWCNQQSLIRRCAIAAIQANPNPRENCPRRKSAAGRDAVPDQMDPGLREENVPSGVQGQTGWHKRLGGDG